MRWSQVSQPLYIFLHRLTFYLSLSQSYFLLISLITLSPFKFPGAELT